MNWMIIVSEGAPTPIRVEESLYGKVACFSRIESCSLFISKEQAQSVLDSLVSIGLPMKVCST